MAQLFLLSLFSHQLMLMNRCTLTNYHAHTSAERMEKNPLNVCLFIIHFDILETIMALADVHMPDHHLTQRKLLSFFFSLPFFLRTPFYTPPPLECECACNFLSARDFDIPRAVRVSKCLSGEQNMPSLPPFPRGLTECQICLR